MKGFILFSISVLYYTSFTGALAQDKYFRSDYKYHEEIDGWMKMHIVPANWHDARLRCQLEGAVLMSPLNEAMHRAMYTQLSNYKMYTSIIFTGVHATFSKGDFHSVEGVPLANIPVKWVAGEPNNNEDKEDCTFMNNRGDIGDTRCDNTFRYVCYKKYEPLTINDCGTTDKEYQLSEATGSCYKFHSEPRTWSRAFMACAAEGGYLAVINSQKEADVLSKIFSSIPTSSIKVILNQVLAFVGFQDWGEHGSWTTIHGQTLKEAGYSHWSEKNNEPNNVTTAATNWQGEYCGSIYTDGKLNDLWCNYAISFICEMDPPLKKDTQGEHPKEQGTSSNRA